MELTDREKLFEKHLFMKQKCDRQFFLSFMLNFIPAVLIMVISAGMLYYWFSSIVMNNYARAKYTELIAIRDFDFTYSMVTLPLAFMIALLSFLSSACRKKLYTIILMATYAVLLIVSFILLVFKIEFKWYVSLLALIYFAYGLWTQDLTLRNYKVIKYLEQQDGYPSFLILIDNKKNSEYSKQRDKWLEKIKGSAKSYEAPIPKAAIITTSEDNNMEGIALPENADEILPNEYYNAKESYKPKFKN
jgi:hypothetical protein